MPVALLLGKGYDGLDLRLLTNLLSASQLHPSVYGTSVLRAFILFRQAQRRHSLCTGHRCTHPTPAQPDLT